jgi:alpha-mannosidase
MNNYWETNYRAGQQGFHEFTYSLLPHGEFSEPATDRFAAGIAQPLLVLPVDPNTPQTTFPVRIDAAATVVTALKTAGDGHSYFLRLFNPGGSNDTVTLISSDDRTLAVYLSDMREIRLERVSESFELGPYEIVNILIDVSR